MSCGRDQAIEFGQKMARHLFAKREKAGRLKVEIHISEQDLAAALAVAYDLGREQGRSKLSRKTEKKK